MTCGVRGLGSKGEKFCLSTEKHSMQVETERPGIFHINWCELSVCTAFACNVAGGMFG